MSKRIPILLGFILIAIAIWLCITPNKVVRQFIERLDHLGYDVQLRTRVLTQPLKPASQIAIIDIDDLSLQHEGRWPWPRSKLGLLVDKLKQQGAAVIAFDMFFAEQQENIALEISKELASKGVITPAINNVLKENAPLFDEDAIFAKSFKDAEIVLSLGFLPRSEEHNALPEPILILTPDQEHNLDITRSYGYISNIPVLQQNVHASGFINIYPDTDGIIRKSPLIIQYKNGIYPSLALQAIMSYLSEKISLVTPQYGDEKKLEAIQLGGLEIPTDEHGQMLIPFIGRSYSFPYYSAYDVLQDKIPKDALLGKILFIGTSATGSGDLKATAIQNPFPGVEIQATIVNGILQHHFSYQPAWTYGANLFITIMVGMFCAFLFPYLIIV